MNKFNKRQKIAENIAYVFVLCICLALLLATLSRRSTDIDFISSPIVFGAVNDISIAIVATIMVALISYKLVKDLVIPRMKNIVSENPLESSELRGSNVVKHFNILILFYVCFYLWYLMISFKDIGPLIVDLKISDLYENKMHPEFIFLINIFLSIVSMVSAFFMLYFYRKALYCFTFVFFYWFAVSIFEEPATINAVDVVFGYVVGYSSAVIIYLSWFSKIRGLFEHRQAHK
jgi:hypothetical protein